MKLQWPGWIVALVLGVIVIAVPLLLPHEMEHEAWWNSIPAWWAIFGAVVCAVIVLVSFVLGRVFLEQSEDFYDERS